MVNENIFDEMIKDACRKVGWPLDWLLIKAQIKQESAFDPHAESPVGAQGLMQLMPFTAKEMNVQHTFDAEQNITGGVTYLKIQFEHFPEIPDAVERIKFALASYNGGRGYVNEAIKMAREKVRNSNNPDKWQLWSCTGMFLPLVVLRGLKPNSQQMLHYVVAVLKNYIKYKSNHKKSVKEKIND